MAHKTVQQRLIADRAHALAVVYLTRRDDLIVTEAEEGVGVDLWVTLNLDGREGHRKFAVQSRGMRSAVSAEDVNQGLGPDLRALGRSGPFPFPVALFLFTTDRAEGWYTWAAEPRVLPGGGFDLVQHGEASCRPLNSRAIDEIVDAVDRWYDAFFATATRAEPSKRKRDRTSI